MAENNKHKATIMPILTMRGMVLFPQMILHFDVGREKSMVALNEAMLGDRMLFLSAQKDIRIENPGIDEIYEIGVISEVKQIVKAKGHFRVLVEGKRRAKILSATQDDPYLEGLVEEFPNSSTRGIDKKMISALERSIKTLFEEYSIRSPRMNKDLLFGAVTENNPLILTEYVLSNLPIPYETKQLLLEETSVVARLRMLIQILEEENDILSLEQEIYDSVRSQIDNNQREYYLREQLKAISAELGEEDNTVEENIGYHETIDKLKFNSEDAEKLHKEVNRLSKMPSNSQEANVVKTWLDTALDLPWQTKTVERADIGIAQKQLDKDHYGMKKVKERILEMISVRSLAPNQKGQIICFVGPPGVGKTSIAKSVAEAINRKYVRMSLGGVRDESDIRGHRKTYIGAMPGRIINALSQSKSKNPLMLLDEIDKLGNDFRGDPSSALLEVLDSEQNYAFRDHYIEVPFDLSEVLFIATANDLSTIPAPLLDRMEIIELGSYTREEKYNIAKTHLMKKQLLKHGLAASQLKISKSALYDIIDYYTREAGVRTLERQIANVCRKTAKIIVSGEAKSVSVTSKKLIELIGAHKFKQDVIGKTDEVGLVNGLAWTSVGGEMLQVEVAVLEGNGAITLTGSLGDIMKESARTAISYIRTVTDIYGIDKYFYQTKDIHIHVPEGAVPKDGPSAGVTITTAVISALSGIPAKGAVAMTGETSLRGRVLPIGGLREKSMAAYRNGITKVIIPEANVPDLDEVDEVVKESVEFIPAKHIDTVLNNALAWDSNRTIAPYKQMEITPIGLPLEKNDNNKLGLMIKQ